MEKPEIFQKLQEVFDNTLMDPVVVTESLSAKDVEEWDSLLNVSLVLAIEDAFKIRFKVGEVESAANLGELADLIQTRTKAR